MHVKTSKFYINLADLQKKKTVNSKDVPALLCWISSCLISLNLVELIKAEEKFQTYGKREKPSIIET